MATCSGEQILDSEAPIAVARGHAVRTRARGPSQDWSQLRVGLIAHYFQPYRRASTASSSPSAGATATDTGSRSSHAKDDPNLPRCSDHERC